MESVKEWALFHKRELVFGAIIFIVATLAFGSGYSAARAFNHAQIIIEKCSSTARTVRQ